MKVSKLNLSAQSLMDGEDPVTLEEVIKLIKQPKKGGRDLNKIDKYFRSIKFFKDCHQTLELTQYRKLLGAIEYEQVRKNQFLYHFGDKGNKFYVVLKGHCLVIVPLKPPKQISVPYQQHIQRVLMDIHPDNCAGGSNAVRTLGNLGESSFAELPTLTRGISLPMNRNNSLAMRSRPKHSINSSVAMFQAAVTKAQKSMRDDAKEEAETKVLDERYNAFSSMDNPKSKMCRAKSIIGFFLVKTWHDHVSKKRADMSESKQLIQVLGYYKPKKYWHNLVLFGLRNADYEFVSNLFPSQLRVFQYGAGGEFGELALLEGGIRKAGIYCDEDCEFAVLTKRQDDDFLFIYRARQRDKESILKSLSPFDFWIKRNLLGRLFQYLTEETKPLGSIIYSRNSPVSCIYLLAQGEVELTLKRYLDDGRDAGPVIRYSDGEQHHHHYRRLVAGEYLFGVEEVIVDTGGLRVFEARVFTQTCKFFKLKLEVVF